MALSGEQQQALDELAPPVSLDRIVRFLSDLGAQGNTPLGESGRSAQAFVASLTRETRSFSARQTSRWVAVLMDRYQIKLSEIQEFALWFVRRQEILSETNDLVKRAPNPVLARTPDSDPALRFDMGLAQRPLAAASGPAALTAGLTGVDSPVLADSAPLALPPARTALRRQPAAPMSIAPPLDTDAEDASPALPEERPRRQARQESRAGGSLSRSHRIKRRSLSALEDAPETGMPAAEEPGAEEVPIRRPFRLTPNMITRSAFVTNVGLAGMLTGLNLAPATADTLDPSTLTLASPPIISPTPVSSFGPIFGPLPPSLGMAPTTVTPTFTPTLTPMPATSPLPSPLRLGMRSDGSALPAALTNTSAPAAPSASPDLFLRGVELSASAPQGLETLPGIPAETPIGTPPLAQGQPPLLPGSQSPAVPAAPLLFGMVAGSAALSVTGRLGALQTPAAGTAAPPLTQPLFAGTAPRLVTPGTDAPEATSPALALAVTPEMGQITLMAPPMQIASPQAESSGIAASVDWQALAGGTGPLDEGGLARLKQVLPDQAGVFYPALPVGNLSAGAVNLPLSASLVQSLLQKGYGSVGLGMAAEAAGMASVAQGGKPPASALPAQIVPGKRPMGSNAGVFGHPAETQGGAGALAEAGKGQATRGGVMDFLGLPVRLAPSLGGRSDLVRETSVRSAGRGPVQPQQTLRPEQFAPLRNRLFPAFHSMTVEPDKTAWQKAAPAFGLRDGKPTTLLAPDARVPVQTPTSPLPPPRSQPAASSPTGIKSGLVLPSSQLSAASPAAMFGSRALPGGRNTLGMRPLIGAPTATTTPLSAVLGSPGVTGSHGPSSPFVNSHSPLPSQYGLPRAGGNARFTSPAPLGGSAGPQVSLGLSSPGMSSSRGASSPPGGLSSKAFSSFPSSHRPSGSAPRPPAAAPWTTPFGSTLGLGRSDRSPGGGSNYRSSSPLAHRTLGSPFTPVYLRGSHGAGLPLSSSFPWAEGTSPLHSSFPSAASRYTPSASAMPTHPSVGDWNHSGASSALAIPRSMATPLRLPDSRILTAPNRRRDALSSRIPSFPPFGARTTGGGTTGSFAGAVPTMRLAPPRGPRANRGSAGGPPMTIQRAETTTAVTPAQNRNAQNRAQAPAGPSGSVTGEVNALAGEVWALLKRRLSTEAERRGRW